MINFETIEWRNFLSTGNVPTKIALNGASTTLVIGKNGHGKSTLLDALCFALYGKPFRNITKPQLVNSINGKACKVEVEFKTEGKQYRIVRGIKPNVFEMFVDGTLISQEAALKDYQKTLEKQILKMNYKTFTQVVILGSSSFTPFMKLSAGHRREVIEDILDIKIFSTMSSVLKEKVAELKESIADAEHRIGNLKSRLASQKNLIDVMKNSKEDKKTDYENKIGINERRIEALEKDLEIIDTQIEAKNDNIDAFGDPYGDIDYLQKKIAELTFENERVVKEFDFFVDHDECPSCRQGISTEHKETMMHSLGGHQSSLATQLIDNHMLIEDRNAEVVEINGLKQAIQQLKIDAASIKSEIKTLKAQTTEYRKSLEAEEKDTGDIDAEKAKLKQMAADITALLESKIEMSETRTLQEVSATLLKDSGIKTTIIKEYLPLMNKLINKYLQVQDLYVQFEIDEQFDETIKSRHRDEFTYASFSEGERQRIDLAILFTWREIARLKNSANTNLLILDEVMDGSLDGDGIDSAQSLIDALASDGTNVTVVSHSVDQHIEKFNRVLKFEKKNDYSLMAEVK